MNRKAIIFGAIMVLLLQAVLGAHDTPIYSWPTLGGSAQRAGLSPYAGPGQGCIKWHFEIEQSPSFSATQGADGRIYLACMDGKLYCLNCEGELQWIYDANTPLLSSPSIGPDGVVYVGGENGTVRAVDSEGTLKWRFDTGSRVYSSPLIDESGRIIFGTFDGVVYALNAEGSELWSTPFDKAGSFVASPSLGNDGSIYAGGVYDPNLYALNPEDGTIEWQYTFSKGSGLFASPVVSPDGTLYQTILYDSSLYAIDPNGGTLLWSTDLADPCSALFKPYDRLNVTNPEGPPTRPTVSPDGWSEPVVGPDGTIYVSLDDPYLRAVDPNGSIKWITKLGDVGGFTLTVDRSGGIFAAGDDGALRVIDPNGYQVARFTTNGWLSYPVVIEDKTVLIMDAKDYTGYSKNNGNLIWAISMACIPGDTPDLVKPYESDDNSLNLPPWDPNAFVPESPSDQNPGGGGGR